MKTIWHYDEIPIASELSELIPKLKQEFLYNNPDYYTAYSKGKAYTIPNDEVYVASDANIWKTEGLRYYNPDQNIETNFFEEEEIYPTATMLTKKYLNHCGCSGYSSIEPHSSINRHTDIENVQRRFVRIHIPLIIPEGDSYFEVDGTILHWSNIFAFDNASMHSAHNNTDHRRLIYIIDLSRELLKIN